MNKTFRLILSLGVVFLLTLVIAAPAMAEAAAVTATVSNTAPHPGDVITFNILCNGNYAIMGNGAVTGPLSFVSSSAVNMATSNQTSPILNWKGNGGTFLGVDYPMFTLTYRVNENAQPGEPFALNLTGIEVANQSGQPETVPVTAAITGAVFVPPTASASASASPSASASQSPSASQSAAASQSPTASQNAAGQATASGSPRPSASPGATASGNLDNTPKTGDATTDVWVALAPAMAGLVFLAIMFGKRAFSGNNG